MKIEASGECAVYKNIVESEWNKKIMRITRMNVAKKDRQLKLIVNEKLNDKTEGTFSLIHSEGIFFYLKHEKTAVEASNRLDAMFFFSSSDSNGVAFSSWREFNLMRRFLLYFQIDTLGQ